MFPGVDEMVPPFVERREDVPPQENDARHQLLKLSFLAQRLKNDFNSDMVLSEH